MIVYTANYIIGVYIIRYIGVHITWYIAIRVL